MVVVCQSTPTGQANRRLWNTHFYRLGTDGLPINKGFKSDFYAIKTLCRWCSFYFTHIYLYFTSAPYSPCGPLYFACALLYFVCPYFTCALPYFALHLIPIIHLRMLLMGLLILLKFLLLILGSNEFILGMSLMKNILEAQLCFLVDANSDCWEVFQGLLKVLLTQRVHIYMSTSTYVHLTWQHSDQIYFSEYVASSEHLLDLFTTLLARASRSQYLNLGNTQNGDPCK